MDKELLRNKVVREIIALIAGGNFRQVKRLPAERNLSRQFAVSRGTIRQALDDLRKLEIIEIRPGSGAFVRGSDKTKIPDKYLPANFENISLEDVVVARKAIELTAVELACQKITPSQLNKLARLMTAMERAQGDLPALLHYDMDFHQTIVRASRNAALVTAFDAIYEYHRFSQVFSSRQLGQDKLAINYHRKIFQAVSTRNAKLSRKLLDQHLDSIKTPAPRAVRDTG